MMQRRKTLAFISFLLLLKFSSSAFSMPVGDEKEGLMTTTARVEREDTGEVGVPRRAAEVDRGVIGFIEGVIAQATRILGQCIEEFLSEEELTVIVTRESIEGVTSIEDAKRIVREGGSMGGSRKGDIYIF